MYVGSRPSSELKILPKLFSYPYGLGQAPAAAHVSFRFATKVLNMADLSPGARGHYERLLHERHWTVGHNSCKGAKTESDRKLLLRCPLCASDATSADDTYDLSLIHI